jgi:hypothetical protein
LVSVVPADGLAFFFVFAAGFGLVASGARSGAELG